MAGVPPGPNALSASPAEIIALPGGGCALLGNNEERAFGRGELIVPGTGQQQTCDGKGVVKTNQNNLHPNSSSTQFHSQLTQQLNGVIGCPEAGVQCSSAVQHHVQHLSHRTSDSHKTSPEFVDGAVQLQGEATENNNLPKATSCMHHNHTNNNGLHCTTTNMTIADTNTGQLETDNTCVNDKINRTESNSLPGDPVSHGATEGAEAGAGRGEQRARVASAVGVSNAVSEEPTAAMAKLSLGGDGEEDSSITYVRYESELQMPDIIRLITKDLSEPYSIYTYRYFIHNWPQLCFLAMVGQDCVGAIVCKLDMHKKMFRRGYIAMLAVDSKFRRRGIGTNLVKKAIYAMVDGDCDEVVLETEITNRSALKLYENLGFVRDKRLFRYYLNGVDALRLKLWLR